MKKGFSFQHSLWSISGAEYSILEGHKTDHKKYAAIGSAILVTSFIAFLSGTAAAWFFTVNAENNSGNILGAIAFGIVWSILIFCIDRCLVITLRKRPDQKIFWWVVPFLSRALLACIIAFMVSIPVELVFFDSFIEEQAIFWNEDRKNTLSSDSYANHEATETQQSIDQHSQSLGQHETSKKDLTERKNQIEKDIRKLKNELNNPTTSLYNNAKNDKYRFTQELNTEYSHRRDSLYYSRNKSRVDQRIRELNRKIQSCNSTINSEIKKWNDPRNVQINNLEKDLKDILHKINDEDIAIRNESNKVNELQNSKDSLIQERSVIVNNYEKVAKKSNYFIRNFQILQYGISPKQVECRYCGGKGLQEDNVSLCVHCKGSGKLKNQERPYEFYFLWLIRLLFFIIELLPTVVKLAMPMGKYELDIHHQEEIAREYFQSKEFKDKMFNLHEMMVHAKEQQLNEQIEFERNMRNELMEIFKKAQMEIAEFAVKKWEEKEKEKLS